MNVGDRFVSEPCEAASGLAPIRAIAGVPLKSSDLKSREGLYRASLEAIRLFLNSLDDPLDSTLQKFADMLVAEFSPRLVLIGRLDKSDSLLKVLAASGSAADYAAGLSFSSDPASPMGRGPAGQVLRSGQPMTVAFPEASNSPDLSDWTLRARRFGLSGIALLPVLTRDGVWGLLNVYRGESEIFTPEMLHMLEGFSAALATFLNRVEESRELGFRRAFQTVIGQLQTVFLAHCTEDEIRESLVGAIAGLPGLPDAWVLRQESRSSGSPFFGSDRRLVLCSSSKDDGLQKSGRVLSGVGPDCSSTGAFFMRRTHHSRLVSAQSSPVVRFLLQMDPAGAADRNAWVFPLSFDDAGQASEFLVVSYPVQGVEAPPGFDLHMAPMVNAAQVALELARDRKMLERYSAFYRAIGLASQLMARHPEPTALFDGVCEILEESTGLPLAFISTVDNGSNARVVAARGKSRKMVEGSFFPVDPGNPARCQIHVRTLESSAVRSIEFPEKFLNAGEIWEKARPYGLKHMLTVAIRKDGKGIGILALASDEPAFFDDTLEELLAGLARDITFFLESNERQERLNRLSYMDFLTALPNRISFQDTVEKAMANAGKEKESAPFFLGILDLDGFKGLNDTFGHAEGDRLLRDLSARLLSVVSEEGGVARLGGDEFGFFLPDDGEDAVKRFSETVLGTIEAVDSERNLVTGSLGWASFPQDGKTFRDLLAHADEALYAAKRGGRNTFRMFGGEIADALGRRIEIHRAFPAAIQKEEILFYLQPQMDCRTGTLEGVEMLARWQSDGGLLPPGMFIPEVEKDTKMIRTMGRYALRHAAALRERLSAAGIAVRISLNIGAMHFLHSSFLDDVDATDFGGDGTRVVIEVTESAALEDIARTTVVIEQLKKRGFGVSLDDFGTGYSSLHYAADLTMTEIKLDQHFVSRFRFHTNAFAVVSSTLLLSALCGSSLIAEGVECQEDLDLWLRMGGRKIQGYLVSKPVPEGDFIAWAKAPRRDFSGRGIPVYPTEDMTFLEFAYRQRDLFLKNPGHRLQECPLESWFSRRGHVYGGVLAAFPLARELHRLMHSIDERTGSRSPEIVDRFQKVMERLLLEMDAHLRAQSSEP